jgi:hypothetical protein
VAAGDLDEPRVRPAADGALVPLVGVDGHLGPPFVEQRLRELPGRSRHEPAAAGGRDQEPVEAAAQGLAFGPPRLEEPDRLAARVEDDPVVDGRVREVGADLRRRRPLVVPVASDLRIGVPGGEQIDVVVCRRPVAQSLFSRWRICLWSRS